MVSMYNGNYGDDNNTHDKYPDEWSKRACGGPFFGQVSNLFEHKIPPHLATNTASPELKSFGVAATNIFSEGMTLLK